MIVIGTRGSALALAQTEQMKAMLLGSFPDTGIAVRIIKTSADKDTTTSIRSGSAVGVFVKELEQALLCGEIDIAVHSMKDVPTNVAAGPANRRNSGTGRCPGRLHFSCGEESL